MMDTSSPYEDTSQVEAVESLFLHLANETNSHLIQKERFLALTSSLEMDPKTEGQELWIELLEFCGIEDPTTVSLSASDIDVMYASDEYCPDQASAALAKRLQDAFREIDADEDVVLNEEEMEVVLRKILAGGHDDEDEDDDEEEEEEEKKEDNPSSRRSGNIGKKKKKGDDVDYGEAVRKIMASIDINGDGKLHPAELASAVLRRRRSSIEHVLPQSFRSENTKEGSPHEVHHRYQRSRSMIQPQQDTPERMKHLSMSKTLSFPDLKNLDAKTFGSDREGHINNVVDTSARTFCNHRNTAVAVVASHMPPLPNLDDEEGKLSLSFNSLSYDDRNRNEFENKIDDNQQLKTTAATQNNKNNINDDNFLQKCDPQTCPPSEFINHLQNLTRTHWACNNHPYLDCLRRGALPKMSCALRDFVDEYRFYGVGCCKESSRFEEFVTLLQLGCKSEDTCTSSHWNLLEGLKGMNDDAGKESEGELFERMRRKMHEMTGNSFTTKTTTLRTTTSDDKVQTLSVSKRTKTTCKTPHPSPGIQFSQEIHTILEGCSHPARVAGLGLAICSISSTIFHSTILYAIKNHTMMTQDDATFLILCAQLNKSHGHILEQIANDILNEYDQTSIISTSSYEIRVEMQAAVMEILEARVRFWDRLLELASERREEVCASDIVDLKGVEHHLPLGAVVSPRRGCTRSGAMGMSQSGIGTSSPGGSHGEINHHRFNDNKKNSIKMSNKCIEVENKHHKTRKSNVNENKYIGNKNNCTRQTSPTSVITTPQRYSRKTVNSNNDGITSNEIDESTTLIQESSSITPSSITKTHSFPTKKQKQAITTPSIETLSFISPLDIPSMERINFFPNKTPSSQFVSFLSNYILHHEAMNSRYLQMLSRNEFPRSDLALWHFIDEFRPYRSKFMGYFDVLYKSWFVSNTDGKNKKSHEKHVRMLKDDLMMENGVEIKEEWSTKLKEGGYNNDSVVGVPHRQIFEQIWENAKKNCNCTEEEEEKGEDGHSPGIKFSQEVVSILENCSFPARVAGMGLGIESILPVLYQKVILSSSSDPARGEVLRPDDYSFFFLRTLVDQAYSNTMKNITTQLANKCSFYVRLEMFQVITAILEAMVRLWNRLLYKSLQHQEINKEDEIANTSIHSHKSNGAKSDSSNMPTNTPTSSVTSRRVTVMEVMEGRLKAQARSLLRDSSSSSMSSALEYMSSMDRTHILVPPKEVLWSCMDHGDRFTLIMPTSVVRELVAAAKFCIMRGIDHTNYQHGDVQTLVKVKKFGHEVAIRLMEKHGNLSIQGLDIDSLAETESEREHISKLCYYILCSSIGRIDDTRGRLFDVKDRRLDVNSDNVLFSASSQECGWHSDGSSINWFPDIVGLMCIRPAEKGGEFYMSNACNAYYDLCARLPKFLMHELTRPLARDIIEKGARSGFGMKKVPTPTSSDSSAKSRMTLQEEADNYWIHLSRQPSILRERIRLNSYPIFERNETTNQFTFRNLDHWLYSGHAKAGLRVSPLLKIAVKELDKALNRHCRFSRCLRRGEISMANNHLVAHRRDEFSDPADKEFRRLLVRCWLHVD